MRTHITGKFKYTSWDENAYEELESGRRLTRASVVLDVAGDLEGEGSAEWLMCYRPDKTATFTGLQTLRGRLGDRQGSFVGQSDGTFDGERARPPASSRAGGGRSSPARAPATCARSTARVPGRPRTAPRRPLSSTTTSDP